MKMTAAVEILSDSSIFQSYFIRRRVKFVRTKRLRTNSVRAFFARTKMKVDEFLADSSIFVQPAEKRLVSIVSKFINPYFVISWYILLTGKKINIREMVYLSTKCTFANVYCNIGGKALANLARKRSSILFRKKLERLINTPQSVFIFKRL